MSTLFLKSPSSVLGKRSASPAPGSPSSPTFSNKRSRIFRHCSLEAELGQQDLSLGDYDNEVSMMDVVVEQQAQSQDMGMNHLEQQRQQHQHQAQHHNHNQALMIQQPQFIRMESEDNIQQPVVNPSLCLYLPAGSLPGSYNTRVGCIEIVGPGGVRTNVPDSNSIRSLHIPEINAKPMLQPSEPFPARRPVTYIYDSVNGGLVPSPFEEEAPAITADSMEDAASTSDNESVDSYGGYTEGRGCGVMRWWA